MKRELNLIDNSLSAKQSTLESLKKELARVKEVNSRAEELQALSAQYDEELKCEQHMENKIIK